MDGTERDWGSRPAGDVPSGGEARRARDAEPFLAAVIAGVPGFVIRADAELRIRSISRLLPGYRMEDVVGRSVFDFVAPKDVAAYRAEIERVRRAGLPGRFELQGAGPPGQASLYDSQIVPIDDPATPGEICIVAFDVSAHRSRQVQLAESQERLRLAVEATGIGLWSWDVETGQVQWDDQMKRLLGRSEPVAFPIYLAEVVHPEDRAAIEAHAQRVFESSRWTPEAHRIVRPDGQVRWIVALGSVVSEGDRVVRILGGTVDVTEQRSMEAQLRQAQKLDEIGALSAGLAHNFNNLLTAILPAFELLENGAAPGDRELVRDASLAAARAVDLVGSLMRFAGGRRGGARTLQELAPTLQQSISLCARTFERHIVLDVELPGGLPLVSCEPGALEQVWLNLLLNSRDALRGVNGRTPRITLRADRASPPPALVATADGSQRFVRVCVTDNGVGMSDEIRAKIFEPFFTTKPLGAGTGLGLPTSYAIVRDHGGVIECSSTPDVGTIVSVYLPIAEERAEVVPPAARPAALPGCMRVLLVDDEALVRNVVARVLARAGHLVTAVATREAALEALRAAPIDLVLLDRSMPGGPGETFIADFRACRPHARILLFSGEVVDPEVAALADGVVQKPVRREELLAVVAGAAA